MAGYGFRRRRRGFTLVEVMLATVAGTSLMLSMVYTSREIKRAVDTAYNEAILQTLARDLNENLERRLPMVLGEMAFSNESISMPVDASEAALPGPRLARVPYAMGAVSVGLADRARWMPAPGAGGPNKPTPTPVPTTTPTATPTAAPTAAPTASPTPTPAPTAAPTATPTPIASATPTPAPSGGEGQTVVPPSYIDEEPDVMPEDAPEIPTSTNTNNQTLQLGNFAVRFEDDVRGGKLTFTKADGTWGPILEIGDRGMIDQAYFAFGGWLPPTSTDPEDRNLRYTMRNEVWKKLITMTTKLAKNDMLPFFLQSVWAPRNTWQWVKDTTADMPDPPTGWSEPPSAKNFPNGEGLFPAAVPKDMITEPTWDKGWSIDVLNGEGTGSFGWVSFPENANNVTLVNELVNPGLVEFYDPELDATSMLDIDSTVQTLTGNHGDNWRVPIAQFVAESKVVTTMVYDETAGNGGNRTFHIAGFAKWEVVAVDEVTLAECVDCDGDSNYLKFIGYSDEEGNLMPPGFTPW